MNKTVEEFTRQQIKEKITTLPQGWVDKFVRMYAGSNTNKTINEVVDEMPVKKLDWALTQVENSQKKLGIN